MSFEFLDLKRPQYPATVELLLSTLAWAVVPRDPSKSDVGLLYERKRNPAQFTVHRTRPSGDAAEAEFISALENRGLKSLDGALSKEIGQVILDALCGITPEKGVGRASSSMGIAGALLQDARGSLGVNNPPNFANLLNTMYALGAPEYCQQSAATTWFDAARYYSRESRSLLYPIERAFVDTSLRGFLPEEAVETWPPPNPEPIPSSLPSPIPQWWYKEVIEAGVSTPFSWFRTSWNRLCSDKWIERLTPRRWTVWALCVARHALGFGFLWESNFFTELARGAVDPQLSSDEVARRAIVPVQPLIPHPQGSVAQMDVMPGINRALTIGLGCRNAVMEISDSIPHEIGSLREFVLELRNRVADDDLRDSLMRALRGDGKTGGLPNLKETVRYSLLARRSTNTGDEDDHALLQVVSRRFVHVAPGTEWIVVMSAVSGDLEMTEVRLGDVLESMKALSFQPRISFLLGELEKAGLCASASDGDEGIQINLGFGNG